MKLEKFITVAIDGGAGSGKSTTSRLLAEKLNFMHVDTGSHYRVLSHFLIKNNISPDETINFINLNKFNLNSEIIGNTCHFLINKHKVPDSDLRSEIINLNVSSYASIPDVRTLLFDYQRSLVDLSKNNSFSGLVMEGRDIGTIILPNADLKLFLHASQDVRVSRRSNDGQSDSISLRDKLDSGRKVAPLTPSFDSISIDTGVNSVDHVFTKISNLISNL